MTVISQPGDVPAPWSPGCRGRSPRALPSSKEACWPPRVASPWGLARRRLVRSLLLSVGILVVLLDVGIRTPSWADSAPLASPTPRPSRSHGPPLAPAPSPSPCGEEGALEVNPYGPSVTNPATLTNVGVPEYEVYYFHQGASPTQASQVQTPVIVKYTWAPQWQISLGTAGFTQVTSDPSRSTASALGDPGLTLKYLYQPQTDHSPAQAVQFTYQVAASPASLGVSDGRPEYFLTWLCSKNLGQSVSMDANIWGNHLEDTAGVWRLQFCQSADLNWEFAKNLSFTAELHHFGPAGPQFRDVWATQAIFTYKIAPSVALSAGMEFGLNQDAPRNTFMTGIVFLFGGSRHGSKPATPTSMKKER